MKRLCFLFSCLLLIFLSSCSFYDSLIGSDDFINLSFEENEINIDIGAMEMLELKSDRDLSNADIKWNYDSSILYCKSDNYGIIFTGLKTGSTVITAEYSSNCKARCIVNVTTDAYIPTVTNPYVYSTTDYLSIEKGETAKVCASLFGGTNADLNGFSWSIDKPSVASLTIEGNYCWLKGITDGLAKVTVKHTKAAYGYSFLVNVTNNNTKFAYLSTKDNIVTINLSSDGLTRDVSFSLMNSNTGDIGLFTYSLVNENGSVLTNPPCTINSTNGNTVNISGVTVGNCLLRCHHPETNYDLDVLVRVVKDAELKYIEPSETLVTVSDTAAHTVSLSLINSEEAAIPGSFKWSIPENADKYISYDILNGNGKDTGDKIVFTGKSSGKVNITVSYPGCAERNIIIIIRNAEANAASVSTYITTNQNFIKLKKGESVCVNVLLNDCKEGDIDELTWGVVNTADDGSSKNVISWVKGNGEAIVSSSRTSDGNLSYAEQGYCIIYGENTGTAYISISHPRAIYPTKINIKVEDEKPDVLESFITIPSSPIIYLKNGETTTVSVLFSGSGMASELSWKLDDLSLCSVSPNGEKCAIVAPPKGSGIKEQKLTVSHKNTKHPVSFTILTSDTDNDVSNYVLKALFTTEQTYRKIPLGGNQSVLINTKGITDFNNIKWNVVEGNENVYITSNSTTDICVNGIKSGRVVLKASHTDCNDLYFTFDIYDTEIIDVEQDVYLSTINNVVYFDKINESKDITVSLFNTSELAYKNIEWSCNSEDFELTANGKSATITALKEEAKGIVTVTHPKSSNTLTIYLQCGNKYEFINTDYAYITTDNETIELVEFGKDGYLTAKINHTEDSDSADDNNYFSFAITDSTICNISYTAGFNKCTITPLKEGVSTIVIRNSKFNITKDVIVIVKKTENGDNIPYITTANNVVTVLEGDSASITANLVNSDSLDITKWHWNITGDNRNYVSIVGNNGNTALIKGLKSGQGIITLTHDDCNYSLKFVVIVLSGDIITTNPYIMCSDNILTLHKGESTSITASLIGGNSPSDVEYFNWSISDGSVALLGPAGANCSVTAAKTGMCYITIKNSRYSDSYTKSVLVIVEDTSLSNVYITASQSVVKITPEDKNLTVITAELHGGEVKDGADFVWWTDDPNILAITPVADKCSITSTGKAGSTKLHVKHSKASKVCDIVVLISKFEDFAFSDTTMKITSGRLYFTSLNIPSVESEYTVDYKSDDEDICYIDGSTEVAYIAGNKAGSTTLWAYMRNKKDGEIISTAQMLVSVTVQAVNLPVISTGDTIINTDVGSAITIAANISGANIDENEKYNLKWKITSPADSSSVVFLNKDADGYFTGADCKLEFKSDGKYILTISHIKTGVTSQVLINVQKKGELRLKVNPDYTVVYKEDGTFKITATIENGSAADYNSLTWSCVKPNGSQIVKLSKSNGKECTVTPVKSGTTTVYAKLPNGIIGKCIVSVQENAEIRLSSDKIHVIPGKTVVVDYTLNPPDASVLWVMESSAQTPALGEKEEELFTYSVDAVAHKLYITGKKAYLGGPAGQLKGIITSQSTSRTAILNIFVEYDLKLNSYLGKEGKNYLTELNSKSAATENKQYFRLEFYPDDMNISFTISDQANCKNASIDPDDLLTIGTVSSTTYVDGIDTWSLKTYSITPRGEGECKIKIKATLADDETGKYFVEKAFNYKCYYDTYHIKLVPMADEYVGAYSTWEAGNTLKLGDGEQALCYLECTDENNNCKIELGSGDTFYCDMTSLGEGWNRSFTIKKEDSASTQNKPVYRIKGVADYYRDPGSDNNYILMNRNFYYNYPGGQGVLLKRDAATTTKFNYRWGSWEQHNGETHAGEDAEFVIGVTGNGETSGLYNHGVFFSRLFPDNKGEFEYKGGLGREFSYEDFNALKLNPSYFIANYSQNPETNKADYKGKGEIPQDDGLKYKTDYERSSFWDEHDGKISYEWNEGSGKYFRNDYSYNWILNDSDNRHYYPTHYNYTDMKVDTIGCPQINCVHQYLRYSGKNVQIYDCLDEIYGIAENNLYVKNEDYRYWPPEKLLNVKVTLHNFDIPGEMVLDGDGWRMNRTLYDRAASHSNPNRYNPYKIVDTPTEARVFSYNQNYYVSKEETLPYIITKQELNDLFTFPDVDIVMESNQGRKNVFESTTFVDCHKIIKGGNLLTLEKNDYVMADNINTTILNPAESTKVINFKALHPNGATEEQKASIKVIYQVRECHSYTKNNWSEVNCGPYVHLIFNNK